MTGSRGEPAGRAAPAKPALPRRSRRISRTAHLYIAWETLKSLLLVVLVFESVLCSIFAFTAVRNYLIDLGLLLPILAPVFAAYLNPALPVSLLFSVPLVYGRLIADREMAALKGFGFSYLELALAPAALGSLISVVVLLLNLYLIPSLRFTRDNLGRLILQQLRYLEEGTNLKFPLSKDYTLWIEQMRGEQLKGIFIGAEGGRSLGLNGLDEPAEKGGVLARSYPLFLYAQEGEVMGGADPAGKLYIELRAVSVFFDTEYRDKGVSTDLRDFKQRVDFSRLELPVTMPEERLSVKELPEPALRRKIRRSWDEWQAVAGRPEEEGPRKWEYFSAVTEYNRRISSALVSLSFPLVAAMLALYLNSPNRLLPVFVSLMVAAPVYYVLELLGNNWSRQGIYPSWFFCQLGNLGLISLAALLAWVARKRTLW